MGSFLSRRSCQYHGYDGEKEEEYFECNTSSTTFPFASSYHPPCSPTSADSHTTSSGKQKCIKDKHLEKHQGHAHGHEEDILSTRDKQQDRSKPEITHRASTSIDNIQSIQCKEESKNMQGREDEGMKEEEAGQPSGEVALKCAKEEEDMDGCAVAVSYDEKRTVSYDEAENVPFQVEKTVEIQRSPTLQGNEFSDDKCAEFRQMYARLAMDFDRT